MLISASEFTLANILIPPIDRIFFIVVCKQKCTLIIGHDNHDDFVLIFFLKCLLKYPQKNDKALQML